MNPEPVELTFPNYTPLAGPRKGQVLTFQYVTLSDYNRLIAEFGPKDGLRRVKMMEFDRAKSARISSDPDLKRKATDYRRAKRHLNVNDCRTKERARQRDYYRRNWERILARQRAKRVAERAA
jgi:hypothetical protein